MNNSPTISVVINTLNEVEVIADCLKSVAWADEVIVVDMRSDDATQAIAKKHGAKVFSHKRVGLVEPARNFAIDKATGDWILIVDADEQVPPALAERLREISRTPAGGAYEIAEKNMVFGQWIQHGTLWPDYHVRFFKRGMLRWPSGVHEAPKLKTPAQKIAAREELAFHHRSRSYRTVSDFIETYVIRYSQHETTAMHERPEYTFRRRHILVVPWREFKLRFITTKGYRDGYIGLVLATLFAAYRAVAIIRYWDRYQPKDMRDSKRSLISYLTRLYLDR